MRRRPISLTAAALFCLLLLPLEGDAASEIRAQVLSAPSAISKYADFYVRVRVTNDGSTPLRGCDRSEERCIALAWDLGEDAPVVSVPKKNIVPLLTYAGNYLLPGQAVEKSVRIPVGALSGRKAVLSLYFIVKEGARFILQERRLEMALKGPPPAIRMRRGLVRVMVYGYLGLSVILLFVLFFAKRGRD